MSRCLRVLSSALLVGFLSVWAAAGPTSASAAQAPRATAPTLYVATLGFNGGGIHAVNAATGELGPLVTLGGFGAISEVISPDGSTVYALDMTGVLTPVDTATKTAGPPLNQPPAQQPAGFGLAMSPNGKWVYLAQGSDIIPVSTVQKSFGKPIPVPNGAFGLALSPDGKTMYAAGRASITPIDRGTSTLGTPIKVGFGSLDGSFAAKVLAITPDGRFLYLCNYDKGTVTPIDTKTRAAGRPIAVGRHPSALAITPSGDRVYVTLADPSDTSVPGQLTSIFTRFGIAGRKIPAGVAPHGLWVSPDGRTVYVANGGEFTGGDILPIATFFNIPGSPFTFDQLEHPIDVTMPPDQAPTAAFTSVGKPHGSASTFNGSASFAPSGGIRTYSWQFGDGTSTMSFAPKVSHTYKHAGHYTVTLTVTDTAGTSTTRVFTGQMLSRNGGPSARARHNLTIS